MNLPNKLTMLRILLVPFFVVFVYFEKYPVCQVLALVLFISASITDLLDGRIARSRNLVTDFGKFMDPIADKVLVMAAMLLLVQDGKLSAVAAIVFLSREFIISGFRLVAAAGNVVIAASPLAKVKTTTQLIALILLLLNNFPFSLLRFPMAQIAVWVALVFTVWSGIDYIVKNRGLLSVNK